MGEEPQITPDLAGTDLSSIHVHGLWRTGSTFFWSCLREIPTVAAFYEPFHENMLDRTHARCQESHTSKPKDEIFRHPKVADGIRAEMIVGNIYITSSI